MKLQIPINCFSFRKSLFQPEKLKLKQIEKEKARRLLHINKIKINYAQRF